MKNLMCIFFAATMLVACGPTSNDQPVPGFSKEDARANTGKADHIDYCATYGWYGDGICDTFCAQPDTADCGGASECEVACAQPRLSAGCLNDDRCIEACEDPNRGSIDAFETCVGDHYLCYRTVESCVQNQESLTECETICGHRGEQTGCGSRTQCIDACVFDVAGWSTTEHAAFTQCASQPLCYQTIEQCFASNVIFENCANTCARRGGDNRACMGETECNDFCLDNAFDWSDADAERFEECVDAPLCYRTIDSCMGTPLTHDKKRELRSTVQPKPRRVHSLHP